MDRWLGTSGPNCPSQHVLPVLQKRDLKCVLPKRPNQRGHVSCKRIALSSARAQNATFSLSWRPLPAVLRRLHLFSCQANAQNLCRRSSLGGVETGGRSQQGPQSAHGLQHTCDFQVCSRRGWVGSASHFFLGPSIHWQRMSTRRRKFAQDLDQIGREGL